MLRDRPGTEIGRLARSETLGLPKSGQQNAREEFDRDGRVLAVADAAKTALRRHLGMPDLDIQCKCITCRVQIHLWG